MNDAYSAVRNSKAIPFFLAALKALNVPSYEPRGVTFKIPRMFDVGSVSIATVTNNVPS